MRYFADGPVTLKAIGAGLARIDPQFKIDGGELMRGSELLGELEITAASSDLFAEDLGAWIATLERVASPAARQLVARLSQAKSIVTLRILDGERDPAVTWDLLGPLWSVLSGLSTGLTQSDGQGFYDGSTLAVAIT